MCIQLEVDKYLIAKLGEKVSTECASSLLRKDGLNGIVVVNI